MAGKDSYRTLLLDPKWQKVRLEKLSDAEWQCQLCYDEESTLSVHHKHYIKGRKPWEYEAHELIVLCQNCHEEQHELIEMRKDVLARLRSKGPADIDEFFAVGGGYAAAETGDKKLLEAVQRLSWDNYPDMELGRFLCAFNRVFRMNLGAISALADALEMGSEAGIGADMSALFEKHGLIRGGRHSA